MGWTNFIIIPKLKLVIETNRSINELHDYQKKSLDHLTDEERYEDEQDIGNKNIKNISVKNLSLLFSTYEQANNLAGMEPDKLLLYWLETKGLKYEILSEFQIKDKLEEYKKEYTILRMFEEDETTDKLEDFETLIHKK